MNNLSSGQNKRKISSAITPTQNVRVAKVSAAKFTPDYKMIPKFSHVPQAVINPSPKKPRVPPAESQPALDIYSNSLKISRRIYEEKELPEHLIKMPIDPNATPKVAKVVVNTQGMTAAQKKQAQDAADKAQKEALKQRMVQKNLNLLFAEIKKTLDKPETEDLNERIKIQVGAARSQVNGKRFISYLMSGGRQQELAPSKQEFHQFIKIFLPQIKEDQTQEIILSNSKKGTQASMTDSQEKFVKLDLSQLDAQFDKWIREEETLSGVLNIKLTKTKNNDLKLKFEAWKKRSAERVRIKKRTFDQEKAIRDAFSKYLQNFENSQEPIIECQIAFHNLVEDLEKTRKVEKIEFQLLTQLPDVVMLETSTVDKLIDSLTLSFNADFRVLERFVGWVKSECVMNQYFFNFFDIPDLIVKKQISKKDYEGISKLLLKVKRSYLFHKATLLPDKPIETLNVTDEDLVPLELFDEVLTQIKHKFDDKKIYWQDLMILARKEIQKKVQQLNIDNEKKKKMIQDSVVVTFLNTKLEMQHTQAFDHHFKLQLLYKMLVKGYGEYSSPEELQKVFIQTINIKQSDQNEFKAQLQKEMMKFNGKSSLNDGTESDQTSVHFAMSAKKGVSPERIERADDDMGDRSINSIERGLMQMELAEGADEERYNRESKFLSEKEKREAQMKEVFKDKDGVPYDPVKKFGVIQSEGALIYDNITTSYPLNLPTEYYHDAIKQSMPKNEEKWFIRPHHLESLTQHKQSIKDGVLNTHYFSHYNQAHGKAVVRDEPAEAIKNIEKVLEELKFEQMQLANGQNKDTLKEAEQLRKQCEKDAHAKFEALMNQRAQRDNTNALMIEAYEGVLLRNRRREREILNGVRHEEYERNRPPESKWYEFKHNGFNKELYRNRVALKPNNENKVYLERLQDKDIY